MKTKLFGAFMSAVVALTGSAISQPSALTYHLPLPEADVLDALTAVHAGGPADAPTAPMKASTVITVSGNGPRLFYDHWENGYDPAKTEIWGDGDKSNGYPPNLPGDLLWDGAVIILDEDKIDPARAETTIHYDGRDRIRATAPISCSRMVWAAGSERRLVVATEAVDDSHAGTAFVVPVGKDTADQNEMFEYTGLSIIACARTEVVVDTNGDGIITRTLAEGESMLINGGLRAGATVTASAPVLADLITGDRAEGYESRTFKLWPTDRLGKSYLIPAAPRTAACGSKIWLHNPGDTALVITVETANGTGFVSVGPRATLGYTLAAAARLSADRPFSALVTVDAEGHAASDGVAYGSNRDYDWGYTPVPESELTPIVSVALGWGCAPDDDGEFEVNAAPVWVTAAADTTITANGVTYPLKRLETLKLTTANNDQSGLMISASGDTPIACVWGTDPATKLADAPALDAGATILPLPKFIATAALTLAVDADGNGRVSPGDTVRCDIRALVTPGQDCGAFTCIPVSAPDATPTAVSWNAWSCTLTVPSENAGDNIEFVVKVTADNAAPSFCTASAPILADIAGLVWHDRDGDGARSDGEPPLLNIVVSLSATDGSLTRQTLTDADGRYTFADLPGGSYTVTVENPALFNGSDSATVTISGGVNAEVPAFGLVAVPSRAGVALTVTPETENVVGGHTVTYTYRVTNTGTCPLHNITVKNGDTVVATVEGVLEAGATASVSAASPEAIFADFTHTATVTAEPSDDLGTDFGLPAVSATASVDIHALPVPGAISGVVWFDVNGNGAHDDDEPVSAGVIVQVFDADGNLLAETVTDENGTYAIPECAPGSVTVKFIAPDGCKFANDTLVTDLSSGAALGNLNKTISVDPNARSLMLVVQALAEIDGYNHTVWRGCEVNFNHVLQNTGKTYLKVLSLTDPGMARDDLLGSENIPLPSDEMPNGVIAPGQRVIITHTFAITHGVECRAKVVAVPCDATGRPLTTEEYTGEDETGVGVVASESDLSNRGTGKTFPIGDFVWYDLNENGLQDDTDHLKNSEWPYHVRVDDAGEKYTNYEARTDEDPKVGAPGVRIILWHKVKNVKLSRPDCEENRAGWEIFADIETDENGHYSITKVPWGYYYMQYILPEGFKFAEYHFKDGYNGLKQSYNNSDVSAFANDGTGWTDEMYLKLDAYYDKEVGLVCTGGVIHVEITPGDAAHGEPWVIQEAGDVVYHYTVTNPGMFDLINVHVVDDRFGEVATFESLLKGETKTFDWTGPVEVSGTLNNVTTTGTPIRNNKICGADVKDTDVAEVLIIDNRPASLSGRAWADLDHNGAQDGGEDGVYGVVVRLLDAAGTEVASTVTDADGRYTFTDVLPGDYSVVFVPNSTWEFTKQDAADDDRDSDVDPATGAFSFTLKPATDDTVIDAGLINGVLPGVCDYVWIAEYYNAVIGGNLVTDGGDSEGNLLVAGNANLGGGYSVGLIGPGYGRTRDAAPLGTDALVVAGDLTEGSHPDINGNVVYGGDYRNLTSTYNARIYEHRHVSPVTVREDGNVPEDGSGATIAEIIADLNRFSAYAAALPDNATGYDPELDAAGGEYTSITNWTWRGVATHRNVFVVTNDTWTLNSQGITLDVPADSKVLINVFSSRIEFNNASIDLPKGMSPSQVVFNFLNATMIETSGFEFPGAVFAPKANADLTGASIDGFAFIGGDVSTHTGFEFHDYPFFGFDCSKSPVVARRPALALTLTGDGLAAGSIVRVVSGSRVTFKLTLTNTGDETARAVTLTDPFGNLIEIGDLAPGAEVTRSIVWKANADATLTAVARAFGEADSPYATVPVSIRATASLKTYADAADLAKATAPGPEAAWRPRPDFVISSFEFVNDAAPTLTGDVFSVRLTVKNVGEVSAVPGRVGIYVDHPSPVAAGEVATAESTIQPPRAPRPIRPGEKEVFEFTNLRAPDTAALHIRAFVDADDDVIELSEGNNQAALFAFLTKLDLRVSIDTMEDGQPCVTLSWTAHAAQTYTVLESQTLGGGLDTFHPCEREDENGIHRVMQFPSAGEGVEMSVSVPMDGVGGFYSLRAESAIDVK